MISYYRSHAVVRGVCLINRSDFAFLNFVIKLWSLFVVDMFVPSLQHAECRQPRFSSKFEVPNAFYKCNVMIVIFDLCFIVMMWYIFQSPRYLMWEAAFLFQIILLNCWIPRWWYKGKKFHVLIAYNLLVTQVNSSLLFKREPRCSCRYYWNLQ